MTAIDDGGYEVARKGRVTRLRSTGEWRSSGVEVWLDRYGISLAGWYDSMVGIEGFRLTWAEFDRLRAEVEGAPRSRRAAPTAYAEELRPQAGGGR